MTEAENITGATVQTMSVLNTVRPKPSEEPREALGNFLFWCGGFYRRPPWAPVNL